VVVQRVGRLRLHDPQPVPIRGRRIRFAYSVAGYPGSGFMRVVSEYWRTVLERETYPFNQILMHAARQHLMFTTQYGRAVAARRAQNVVRFHDPAFEFNVRL